MKVRNKSPLKRFKLDFAKNRILYLMVLPAIIFFITFSYIPMMGIYYAFTNFNFGDGIFSPFIGLKNFEFLFTSSTAWISTRNTILYNLVFIFLGNFVQLLVAVLLSEMAGKIGKKITQSVIFLPYFVSYVLLSAFVYNIFNYEYGALNSLLQQLNMQPIDVYSNPGVWKYIIIFFHGWKTIGYGSVVYLAAIMGIDREIYEAANLDGANIFQQIRYITIPLLKPTFMMLILFALGSIMRGQFDLFYQLVGNNGLLFEATDIIDTYVYRSLSQNFDIGMSTAAGVYQSVIGFVLIVTVNKFLNKFSPEHALF